MARNVFKKNCIRLLACLMAAFICFVAVPVDFYGLGKILAQGIDEYPEYDETYIDARESLAELLVNNSVLAVVCSSDERGVSVYDVPSVFGDLVNTLASGVTVQIKDVAVRPSAEGDLIPWYKVSFKVSFIDETEVECDGFIERENLVINNEAFLSWETEQGMTILLLNSELDPQDDGNGGSDDDDPNGEGQGGEGDGDTPPGPSPEEIYEQQVLDKIELFPESYKTALLSLHAKHPNWMFIPYETNLDWQTVINNEVINKKSLVSSGYYGYHREGLCEPGWYYAAENTVKWYMDPRAWLDEKSMFMYEVLSYNESFHTVAALDEFLANSFMKSNDEDGNVIYAPETEKTHAQIFMEAGKNANISPFHLASRVYQEQGVNGSPMVSGNYPGMEHLYNYFNIGATHGSSTDKIVQGLGHAATKGWVNPELAIEGGSEFLSGSYIGVGQDTLYLQKFNVTGKNTYSNQYMQNLAAPSSEAVSTYNMYAEVGKIDSAFIFKIPVYLNMPETATVKPTSSTNVVLQIPTGYKAEVYVDGKLMQGISRNGQYIVNVGDGNAKTVMAYAYTNTGMPAGTKFWTLEYMPTNYYEVTAQTNFTDLLIYHGFSIRITPTSGIRCISSINKSLRDQMTNGNNYNGFTVSEYGTLIMNSKYMDDYPISIGSEKVMAVKSYGSGVNNIYRDDDGRIMYTAVLTDIPESQYKAELAYRSYAILNKNGKQYVFYGPIMTRSIYSQANRYIEAGSYPVGSTQHDFLLGIINAAQ